LEYGWILFFVFPGEGTGDHDRLPAQITGLPT
jgi:hypothetical protein